MALLTHSNSHAVAGGPVWHAEAARNDGADRGKDGAVSSAGHGETGWVAVATRWGGGQQWMKALLNCERLESSWNFHKASSSSSEETISTPHYCLDSIQRTMGGKIWSHAISSAPPSAPCQLGARREHVTVFWALHPLLQRLFTEISHLYKYPSGGVVGWLRRL